MAPATTKSSKSGGGGGGVALKYLVRPFLSLLPEVEPPTRRVPFRHKLIYTLLSLAVFLICSQVPLYGVATGGAGGVDPFHRLRLILASSRGTLMELGISPIVTSSLILQLLSGANILSFKQADSRLFDGAQKLLALFIAIGQAISYVLSGAYGQPSSLGAGNSILIIAQLLFGTIIVVCLDDLLQKGYGLSSAISLFTATNICESIVWRAFSPTTITTVKGTELEGAMLSLVHLCLTRANKVAALREAFFRQHLPNVSNLLATVLVFFVVVYFAGFKIVMPLRHKNARGHQGATASSYAIKLFYTSNMPIMLHSALVSNLYFISQLLYLKFGGGNVFVNLLGKWSPIESGSGGAIATGGLLYYILPPAGLAEMASQPIHAIVYLVFTLSACALFSKAWVQVSGSSAKDVATKLREQQMVMPGHRDTSVQKELNRYIPTAAAFGGLCIGALTVFADFVGAFGSGSGILMAVTIICDFFDTLRKERAIAGDLSLGRSFFL